jgi:hypothetical protein
MFVLLFEPFLFLIAVPAIIWQLSSDEKKKEILHDFGIAILITLILVAAKYSL